MTRTITLATTTKMIDSMAYVPATLLLFSTQLRPHPVDADGFAESYPAKLPQSDVAESNSMIPIDRKIANDMNIATNPITDICSVMTVEFVTN